MIWPPGQRRDVRLAVVDAGARERVRRPVGPLPVDPAGVALGVLPVARGHVCARLEHARDEPAELLLADHVDVLRVVGRHQRPGAVGLAAAGRVVVGQAERVAVLVRDHARVLDRRLGVDVVRADAGEDRDRRCRSSSWRVRARVGPEQRPALEVVRLVVGDVALLAVRRRCSRSGGRTSAARCCRRAAPLSLRVAVAAEPGEDHHEEVDDAVLVGVVGVVVDLRVGDLGGVVDGLAGRAAARVDVLQRADAGRARRSAPSPCRRGRSSRVAPGSWYQPLAIRSRLQRLVGVGRQRRVGDAVAAAARRVLA